MNTIIANGAKKKEPSVNQQRVRYFDISDSFSAADSLF